MEAFSKLGQGSLPSCQEGKAAKRAGNTPPYQDERLCESFNAREATGDGIKGFCQVGYGEKSNGGSVEEESSALEFPLGSSDEGSREVGDEEMQDWVSPRISFSHDFVMEDTKAFSQEVAINSVLSDGKKGEREKDNYSAEFDFLKNGAGYGVFDQAKSFMLSADELFFDGKLLPLPFARIWSTNESLSLPLPNGENQKEMARKANNRTMARHRSFDKPTSSALSLPSSSSSASVLSPHGALVSCSCPSSPSRSILVDRVPSMATLPLPPLSSQTSRMTWPPQVPTSSSTSSSLSSPSSLSKCSNKLKDFFRPSSTTRSFWPFSRSKSTGESKSTLPPQLPCRSNSAGEAHSYTTLSISKVCGDSERPRLSTCSSVGYSETQGAMARACQDDECSAEARMILDVVNVEEDRGSSNLDEAAKSTTMRADKTALKGTIANLGSSSKVHGKKIGGASSKNSPGRRKGALDGCGAKVSGGKIVLKNLERCSVEKKVGGGESWRGVSNRGTYPVGARVSPVLNVAVYRGGGNTSKRGLFGFGNSKKEKKGNETALNWRNGA